MVEFHIAKVDLSTILAKTPLGTPLRWARDAALLLYSEGHREEHQFLMAHIEAADNATLLVAKKARDLSPIEWRSKVKSLQDYGVDWPEWLQDQFFYWYLDEQLSNFSEQNLRAFMVAVLPWVPAVSEATEVDKAEAARDGGDKSLNVLSPKLANMRLGASEKASRFRARLFGFLILGTERGQEYADSFHQGIDFSLDYLENHMSDNEVDASDNATDAFTKAAQAIKQLMNPLDLSFRAELEEVMDSGKKKRKAFGEEDTSLTSLAAAVQKRAYWNAL